MLQTKCQQLLVIACPKQFTSSHTRAPIWTSWFRTWLMALLEAVLVSVTKLIKMHMFGIIRHLNQSS